MAGTRRWIAPGNVTAAAMIMAVAFLAMGSCSSPDDASVADDRPEGPSAPDFVGITQWLNSEALSLAELKGRVVLVDFWTYTCINCIRTMPYLRDWQEKYAGRGLVMVGVHSPEFEFEKRESNVRDAMVRRGVTWPVAMDNDFATWRAYENRYWPHKFLIDGNGIVRYHHIGEGAYLETENQIRNLLTESGYEVSDISVGGVRREEGPGFSVTREIYAGLGWAGGGYLGNPVSTSGAGPVAFSDTGIRKDGEFYLNGVWELDSESVRHGRATQDLEDYIALLYNAGSVNAVIRPEGSDPIVVVASIDGGPIPEHMRGDDIRADDEGMTYFQVDTPKLYNIIRDTQIASHDLRLQVTSPNFVLYTFTFGG